MDTERNHLTETLRQAAEALRSGKPVLIYDADGREEETDITFFSGLIEPASLFRLRRDGGGLVCTTFSNEVGEKLGLPYLSELFYKEGGRYPVLKESIPNDIPYDEGSSFSITINHRRTFTGITDNDRALTIGEFAGFLKELDSMGEFEARERFGALFRAPGHVHLLRCSPELLVKRQGHTELATALCVMAGLTPSATICEMMGDDGTSLPREKAEKYGIDNGLVFIEGSEIIEAWRAWNV